MSFKSSFYEIENTQQDRLKINISLGKVIQVNDLSSCRDIITISYRVGTDLVEKIPQLRTQPFLFASHMDESNQFVDIPGIFPDNSSMLSGYVSLEQLPYNQLWKQRLLDRSSQPYAVQVYIINQSKKDKLSQEK